MRMKCRDCGGTLTVKRANRGRPDVCDMCWDARLLLAQAMAQGRVSQAEFWSIQRKMSTGRGGAKMAIDAVLEADHD